MARTGLYQTIDWNWLIQVVEYMSYLYFRTLISFVVGNIPSARYLLPSRALIILDLPLLNSPTTTSKKSSSSCLIASVRRLSSSISGAASCRASLLRLLEDIFSWLEALHQLGDIMPSQASAQRGKESLWLWLLLLQYVQLLLCSTMHKAGLAVCEEN